MEVYNHIESLEGKPLGEQLRILNKQIEEFSRIYSTPEHKNAPLTRKKEFLKTWEKAKKLRDMVQYRIHQMLNVFSKN